MLQTKGKTKGNGQEEKKNMRGKKERLSKIRTNLSTSVCIGI
jgi:hypothetical protein